MRRARSTLLMLNPGVYTVTEQSIDKYEPQETQRVTIVSGQTATVNFNNKLKRGSLEVTKTSEDGLVEGMTFHLYGTSLSGQPVDEYAVTDGNGVRVVLKTYSSALAMYWRRWIPPSVMWCRIPRQLPSSGMKLPTRA